MSDHPQYPYNSDSVADGSTADKEAYEQLRHQEFTEFSAGGPTPDVTPYERARFGILPGDKTALVYAPSPPTAHTRPSYLDSDSHLAPGLTSPLPVITSQDCDPNPQVSGGYRGDPSLGHTMQYSQDCYEPHTPNPFAPLAPYHYSQGDPPADLEAEGHSYPRGAESPTSPSLYATSGGTYSAFWTNSGNQSASYLGAHPADPHPSIRGGSAGNSVAEAQLSPANASTSSRAEETDEDTSRKPFTNWIAAESVSGRLSAGSVRRVRSYTTMRNAAERSSRESSRSTGREAPLGQRSRIGSDHRADKEKKKHRKTMGANERGRSAVRGSRGEKSSKGSRDEKADNDTQFPMDH